MQVRKGTPDLSDMLTDCGTRPAQKPLLSLSEGDLLWRVGPLRITPPRFAPGRRVRRHSAADGPMTAIIYFGEILVASLLAIVLLALSRLRMGSDAVLFAGGVVAWTLAEYVVHRFVLHGFAPTEHRLHHANPDDPVPYNCLADMDLFPAGLFDHRRRFRCRLTSRLCLVFIRASLRASRSR
jgi:hypothetical protein